MFANTFANLRWLSLAFAAPAVCSLLSLSLHNNVDRDIELMVPGFVAAILGPLLIVTLVRERGSLEGKGYDMFLALWLFIFGAVFAILTIANLYIWETVSLITLIAAVAVWVLTLIGYMIERKRWVVLSAAFLIAVWIGIYISLHPRYASLGGPQTTFGTAP